MLALRNRRWLGLLEGAALAAAALAPAGPLIPRSAAPSGHRVDECYQLESAWSRRRARAWP